MYWSDWGSLPKIEQANMDGTARTTLVSSGLTGVNSLALDYQNRLLYWCDASLDKIERVDLQGNSRVLILDLSPNNLHPFGLALADNVLYWSDWKNQSVHKYNMSSSLSEVLVHGLGRPMEIHIYDNTKIFKGMFVYCEQKIEEFCNIYLASLVWGDMCSSYIVFKRMYRVSKE